MMRNGLVEMIVGVFIIIAIAALVFLGIKVSGLSGLSSSNTYTVTAAFENVGDLQVRAPVTIAGVSIGEISNIKLDPKTFNAVVTMQINGKNNNIPVDSVANIYTAGLLGANYISLTPGWSNDNLKQGSKIENTNPALILQNLIGQLLFSMKSGNSSTSTDTAATGTTPAVAPATASANSSTTTANAEAV